MNSLNPNHPMSIATAGAEFWKNLLVVLMVKEGKTELTIKPEDIARLADNPTLFIAIEETSAGLTLRMVDAETANNLARKNGGLPT